MLREFAVPPSLARRLAGWRAGGAAAPAPRPAATVILVRDRMAGGVEVFLLRRRAAMAFAAGMHVFPGGSVDEPDADPAIGWVGPRPQVLAPMLSADAALSRAIVVAAVRETFEECGVLLAGPDADHTVADPSGYSWDRDRHALAAGTAGLAAVLRARGLLVRADLLLAWAHWITPPFETRRFDTRFFVAAQPPGQHARDLGGESDHGSWLAASEALEQHRAGRIALLPPTLVCLEEVAAAPSVAALLATPRRPRPVMPWPAPGGAALQIDLDGVGGGEPGP